MTPTGPYVRQTLDYTLRLGLRLPRYTTLPYGDTRLYLIEVDAFYNFFNSIMEIIEVRPTDLKVEARAAVRLMEALSR